MSYNRVILIGNVGRDPEVHYFDIDSSMATFTLATNQRGYTRADGTMIEPTTDWHRIKCYRAAARFVEQYVRKGAALLVEGRLQYRDYADARGEMRQVAEIIADRVEYAPLSRREEPRQAEVAPTPPPTELDLKKYADALPKDRDLPF